MALTRFYDRSSGVDGPVSGALQLISVGFASILTNTSASRRIEPPAGCGFEITDIKVSADAVQSDPALTVGTSAGGTQIVAAVNVATNLGAVTIKDGTIAAGGFADIVVTTDTGDTATGISITVCGHITSPPTSVPAR